MRLEGPFLNLTIMAAINCWSVMIQLSHFMVTYNQSTNGIYMRNVPKSMSQLSRLTGFSALSYYLDIKLISNERCMIFFMTSESFILDIYNIDESTSEISCDSKYHYLNHFLYFVFPEGLVHCLKMTDCGEAVSFSSSAIRRSKLLFFSLIIFFFFFFCGPVA